jgi:hypothetical protein
MLDDNPTPELLKSMRCEAWADDFLKRIGNTKKKVIGTHNMADRDF